MTNNEMDQKMSFPPVQAGVVFALALVMMVLAWLLNKIGVLEAGPLAPWLISTALLLLFAVMNALLSLRSDNSLKYYQASVYSFMGLALCNGLAAWLFSGVPIGQAGTYRWITLVVTIGFLVFLSMINLMKKIVRFAEREEWNAPRKR